MKGKLLRFLLVGVLNTALTWAIYLGLAGGALVNPVVANVVGWTAGVICSFMLNRRFTFRSEGRIEREAPLFFVSNVVMIALSSLIVALLHPYGLILAQAVATGVCLGLNFLLYDRIVFAMRRS